METAVGFTPPLALRGGGIAHVVWELCYKFSIRIGFSFCLAGRITVTIAFNGDFSSSNI